MSDIHGSLSCPSSLPNGSVCIAGEVLPNLLDLMPNGIAYCKMLYEEGKPYDFICLYSNPALHRQIGLVLTNDQRFSAISSRIRESHPAIFESAGRVAAGGPAENFEFFIESLQQWVSIQLFSPKPEHFIAIFNDITESKRATEALAESERRYRSILEDQTEIICRFKADGTILYVNDAYCRLFGKSRESLIGNKWQPNAWEEDLPSIHEKLNSLSPANPVVVIENRIITRGGAIRWGQFINRGFFDKKGCLIEMQSIGRDITEQKKAEEALAAQQKMLQSILDYTPAIVFIKDLHERYLLINRYCEKILGIRSAEIRGKTAHEFLPKELADHFAENDRRVIASGQAQQVEETIPEADGPHVYTSVQFPIFDADGRPSAICGISTDITERKQQERKLRKSEMHLRQAQRIGGMGSFIYYLATDRWTSSAVLDALFGIDADYERSAAGWEKLIHPEDRPAMVAALRNTLENGVLFDQEYRIVRPSDGAERWLHGVGETLLDAQQQPYCIVGIDQGITAWKQAEAALREADRQKDEFLATLAHELRNLLAPIRNGLQILRRSQNKLAAENRTLDMMERQLLHMVRLIDDLFDLSRIGRGKIELQKEPVELAAVVKHAVEISRPLITQRNHEFDLLLPAESILVKADLIRLSQVFSNLLNNAAKYTPPGGRITLSIATQERKALVRVQDTGIGIPVSMQERVFDLFTQVDPSVEKSQGGLGIGLSLVKRLVELHGGTVEAHSKGDGLGSEFVVRLPVWQSACLQEQDAVIQKAVANSPAARRILIADDNADAAASLAMLLGMLGHEVYTVKDGQEAVEVAAKRRPELILLDLNMPRLNGYEACRRLRADSWGRNTAIVALTGLGQDQDLQASRAAGFDHHIVKPVDLVELERLLETLPNADVRFDN